MKFRKILLSFSILLLASFTVKAQFGQKLKEKLNNAKEGINKFGERTEERLQNVQYIKNEQDHLDTTVFNYALSQADKSSFFRNRDNKQGFFSVVAKYGERVSDGGGTRAQKAFDFNKVASASLYIDKRAALKAFSRIFNTYYVSGGDQLTTAVHPEVSRAVNEQRFYDLFEEILSYRDLEIADHYALAATMVNISLLMHAHGKVRKAAKMTNYTMAYIYDKIGPESLLAAAVHNNLAVILKDQGRYIEAEDYYKKCEKTLLRRAQKESLAYVILLNNIAMVQQATGRYESAVSMLKKCLELSETKLRKKGGDFTKFKINLALVYQSKGDYQEAESIYRTLLLQKQKRLGQNHPDYAQAQSSLAGLLMLRGQEAEVETLLQNALKIYKEKLGQNHPAYAATLSSLGKYYRHVDRLEDAERIFKQVEDLFESSFNKHHPSYVDIIENLALLRWQQGNIEDSKALYEKALKLKMSEVKNSFPSLSESEKSKYWNTIRPMILRFYNFGLANHEQYPNLLKRMYEIQMATKGLLLSTTVKMRYDILNSGDESLIQLYTFWSDTKEDLAQYYTYSSEELRTEGINLDSLEDVANTSEKELSKRSFLVNEDKENSFVSYETLTALVKPTEAALEIIRLPLYDKKKFSDETVYLILLAKSQTNYPEIVIIDNGQLVESKYAQRYKNSIKYKIQNKESYQHFWGGLDDKLIDISKIYISSDGVYNQVNLSTLRDQNDTYLGERFTFIHVSNTNQLVSGGISPIKGITKAALFGNPDYGSHNVEDLPGTADEVSNIGGMLKNKRISVQTYTNKEASESNFKNMPTPGILHVATHGFFVQNNYDADNQVFGERLESSQGNPMLRSGLILSDASTQNTIVLDGYADDGIITAYEVLTLDLAKTDMVVLSACETGLGEVRAGEGVYGLQRAFKVAGVNTLIMSLWKVNDATTQQLMTSFYKNLLVSQDKVQAFELAQAEIRSSHPEPYYWGAFVMMN